MRRTYWCRLRRPMTHRGICLKTWTVSPGPPGLLYASLSSDKRARKLTVNRMRTARRNVQPAGPMPALLKSSRSWVDSSHNVLHSMPSVGNQAMLRRLSNSAPVVRRDTPSPAAGKTAAPAAPAAGAGAAPAPDASGKTDEVKVTIPWSDILSGKTKILDFFAPPVVQGGAGASAPATAKDTGTPGASASAPKGPVAGAGTPVPAAPTTAPAGSGPAAPSRIPFKDIGSFSFGARMDFAKPDPPPAGSPPSAVQQLNNTGENIDYYLTGKVPTAYQVDKGQLAGVVWSLVSTYGVPDLAAKIAKSLSGKKAGGGVSYQADAVLLGDMHGGGVSFTIKWGGSKAPAPAASAPDPVQRKLAVGSTTDPLEAQADQVADDVMRMPDPAATNLARSTGIQRKCSDCEEAEPAVRRKGEAAAASSPTEAPVSVHQALSTPGQPLDKATRAFFERLATPR
jgi:hypothetical protein